MPTTIGGSTGIETPDVQTPTLNGGQLSGFRNKIINGAFNIDQEFAGASTTVTAGAALKYVIDQFYAYCTGANVTGEQVTGAAPNKFNYQFTGAASVTKIGFAQRMEAINTQDLAGGDATLSVDLANSLLTTVTWTAWYANTENTFGTLASPTRTQIATGTFTVNSTLTRYETTISIPSGATTGIEIELSVGAQTSGTWTIGRVQLEKGSVATAYEYKDVGIELRQCQRYWENFVSLDLNGYVQASKQVYALIPLIPKRVASTVTLGSVGFNDNYASYNITFPTNDFQHVGIQISASNGPANYLRVLFNNLTFNSRL